jgi:hypothetical protein
LIVVETAAFRPVSELAGWSRFAAAMFGTHLWIGVLEGVLTAAIIAAFALVTSGRRLACHVRQAASLPFTSERSTSWQLVATNALAFVVVPILAVATPCHRRRNARRL